MSSTLPSALQGLGACRDSGLSVTSSVLSIVTFCYAVALGVYFVWKTSRESSKEFTRILQTTMYSKLELEVSEQNFSREEADALPQEQRMQMEELFKKARAHFKKWDKLFEAFKTMFPDYFDQRAFARSQIDSGFLHDLLQSFDYIFMNNTFSSSFWRHASIRRMISDIIMALIVGIFYFVRAFTLDLVVSTRGYVKYIGWRLPVWRWPRQVKWMLKQDELLVMMRRTEDIMNEIRSATLRRILQDSTQNRFMDYLNTQLHEFRDEVLQAVNSLRMDKAGAGETPPN